MKTQVEVMVMKVTPEIANEWLLDRVAEQRVVRNRHVERLAADMASGRFKVSPDAILRIKNKLANGQHRLLAVVASGKPQTFLVMESNDDELYKVIDAGMRRQAQDDLLGMKYASHLPPIARWVRAYNNGTLNQSASGASSAAASGSWAMTQSEVIEYCEDNSDKLQEAAEFVNSMYEQTRVFPVSMGGALYVIGDSHGVLEAVKRFLTELYIDGGASAAGDLRNRLILNRSSKSKLRSGYMFGIALKALRCYLIGSRVGVLKWADGEKMPTLDK